MPISANLSAPLFAVVGSTGLQGTSIIRALQDDATTAWRVRAVTRDANQAAAAERAAWGCEVVAANIDSFDDLLRAYSGADYAFAVTIPGPDEFDQGKRQVDAAKAAGVKTLIWSSLPSLTEISGGKYTAATNSRGFDDKARITSYARSLISPTFKVIDVQAGYYTEDFFRFIRPRKQADGSFAYFHIVDTEQEKGYPFVDVKEDYGKYVLGAIKNGGVDMVLAAPEYVSLGRIVQALTNVSGGKTVRLRKISYEEFVDTLKGEGQSDAYSTMVSTMICALAEFGYYGGADLKSSNALLDKPVRTLEEALEADKSRFQKLFE